MSFSSAIGLQRRSRPGLQSCWTSAVLQQARQAGVVDASVQPYLGWLAPHYTRADTASRHFRARLLWADTAVFLIAAVAVAAAATEPIFLHGRVVPVVIEAVLIAALLILVLLARSRKLHQRWLAHRSLAEQCRTTLFLAVAGIPPQPVPGPSGLALDDTIGSSGWVARAYTEILLRRPRQHYPPDLEPLRRFLLHGWVGDQSSYYQALCTRQRRRDQLTLALIYLLFAATLVAAVLHALTDVLVPVQWRAALAYCSIVLPAVGAAVGGIRAQRDYQRTADRAARTNADLHHLKQQLIDAADRTTMQAVAAQVAARLGQENRDWYDDMLFHNVELHI